MDALFRLIEESSLSAWLVESESLFAFPGVLTLHVIGMGFVVGASLVISLRFIGFFPDLPLPGLARFLPVFWIALGLSAGSGLLLVVGYPTKALTNPLFYVKMVAMLLGVLALLWLRRSIVAPIGLGSFSMVGVRNLALASMALWVGTVAAGRLLAYTYTRLLVDFQG